MKIYFLHIVDRKKKIYISATLMCFAYATMIHNLRKYDGNSFYICFDFPRCIFTEGQSVSQ